MEDIDRVMHKMLIEHAASSLEGLIRALVDRMIDAHTADPELFPLLSTQVPQRADGTRAFAVRMHGAFRMALAARTPELKKRHNLDQQAFVVTNMVDALCHGALFQRPAGLSLGDAKAEIVRAILGYLRA